MNSMNVSATTFLTWADEHIDQVIAAIKNDLMITKLQLERARVKVAREIMNFPSQVNGFLPELRKLENEIEALEHELAVWQERKALNQEPMPMLFGDTLISADSEGGLL